MGRYLDERVCRDVDGGVKGRDKRTNMIVRYGVDCLLDCE